MGLKLYYTPASAPCRATLLTINALDLDVELVPLNLINHEHLTTEFLKLNPFHTVPTLQEDAFTIWDSHAINTYLVDKYGKDDSLYPKDLAKRAIVDQRLYFDSGVLQAKLSNIVNSIFKEGAKTVSRDKSDPLIQGLTLLETVLETNKYVAGDTLTLADFSTVATVTTANVVIPLASNRFPKIFDWMARMQTLPYYQEANQEGLDIFSAEIRSKIVVR